MFRIIGYRKAHFDFTVTFSMVELYCQRFVDLLDLGDKDKALKVRKTPDGQAFLENLKEQEVGCPQEPLPPHSATLALGSASYLLASPMGAL